MDPSQQPLGRSRGRGRALYQHPKPHNPEDHPGVSMNEIYFFFKLK